MKDFKDKNFFSLKKKVTDLFVFFVLDLESLNRETHLLFQENAMWLVGHRFF
jgi:hypothetical protein